VTYLRAQTPWFGAPSGHERLNGLSESQSPFVDHWTFQESIAARGTTGGGKARMSIQFWVVAFLGSGQHQ
jgi:hypothetical protein